jgi:hypothetical protein
VLGPVKIHTNLKPEGFTFDPANYQHNEPWPTLGDFTWVWIEGVDGNPATLKYRWEWDDNIPKEVKDSWKPV